MSWCMISAVTSCEGVPSVAVAEVSPAIDTAVGGSEGACTGAAIYGCYLWLLYIVRPHCTSA